jgi:hypothetical protein
MGGRTSSHKRTTKNSHGSVAAPQEAGLVFVSSYKRPGTVPPGGRGPLVPSRVK